jgi:glycosyltransferase involved in cell wall biosynthesis
MKHISKMRIAFVSIRDPEDIRVFSGGPFHILNELRRQGVEVEVIGPLNRWFKYLYAPLYFVEKLRHKNIQIDRHPLALRSYARQIERRLAEGNFDAAISVSSIPVSYLSPGIPVLFWVDSVFQGMKDYYGGAFSHLPPREIEIGNRQEQAAINRASYAIYKSEWAASHARHSYKTRDGAVQVLPNGANIPVKHGIDQVVEWIGMRSSRPCVLLFVGVEWERKGGMIAWDATRILNERGIPTTLRVVGCEAPAAPFVEQYGRINKSSAEGQAKFKSLYETSTFFILPTRAEAAGIVFSEASAYGLPILATKTGGVEYYVSQQENGFCLPLDATAGQFADLIQSTLKDAGLYRRLSLGGYSRFQSLLNWKTSVNGLLWLTESAIEADSR